MHDNDERGAGTDPAASVRQAGQALRQRREELGLTQRDVERLSGGKLYAQQVSRLETGALSKPPMEDLIVLGRIYGLSPSDIAQLYGYDQHAAGVSLSMPAPGTMLEGMPEEGRLGETREMSMLPTPEQLRQLQERQRGMERAIAEEDLARRILKVENLAARLPDPLRLKLTYWLDLIIALLSDELRASNTSR